MDVCRIYTFGNRVIYDWLNSKLANSLIYQRRCPKGVYRFPNLPRNALRIRSQAFSTLWACSGCTGWRL